MCSVPVSESCYFKGTALVKRNGIVKRGAARQDRGGWDQTESLGAGRFRKGDLAVWSSRSGRLCWNKPNVNHWHTQWNCPRHSQPSSSSPHPPLQSPAVSGPSLIGIKNMGNVVIEFKVKTLTVVANKDLFLEAKQDPGCKHRSPRSAPSLH